MRQHPDAGTRALMFDLIASTKTIKVIPNLANAVAFSEPV